MDISISIVESLILIIILGKLWVENFF